MIDAAAARFDNRHLHRASIEARTELAMTNNTAIINREALGPAERIINTLLTYNDHLFHGRPGVILTDPTTPVGVRWQPATWKLEDGEKVAYVLTEVKQGKRTKVDRKRVGAIRTNVRNLSSIIDGHRTVGYFQDPGVFSEVATWFYQQIADVYRIDNEFVARWASYAFTQDHRDLKVMLAAFLLVQSRKGDQVRDDNGVLVRAVDGKTPFLDEDYRAVGEAMLLDMSKHHFDAKMLLRVHRVLHVRGVRDINRNLGFGNSTRSPFVGRWPKAVCAWLAYREENPKLLEGLVASGQGRAVRTLVQLSGYKPISPAFFQLLRWKQKQANDGRRDIAIGATVAAAESWHGLTEVQVCERIVTTKPDWKRIVGSLPANAITRAVVAAAVESGCLSDRDLLIATPTLEALGLLTVPSVKARWDIATKRATDTRARHVAKNVRSDTVKLQLHDAADKALQKAVAEDVKDIRVYMLVDRSGSMEYSIAVAKDYIASFAQAFPLDRLHIVVFNSVARVVQIRNASRAGVETAFRGIRAEGGTDHAQGVRELAQFVPKETEDTLLLVVGDGGEMGDFAAAIRTAGIRPMAIAFVKVPGDDFGCVDRSAAALGIPCIRIVPEMFADPYAIPRTLRTLIAATPVNALSDRMQTRAPRVTLIDRILKTPLLQKPQWA